MFAFQTNESNYPSEILQLLEYLSQSNFFKSYGRSNFEIRNLLRSSFQYFDSQQKLRILDLCKNIHVKDELYIWKDDKNVRRYHATYGLTKYHLLNCIPKEVISKDRQLDKEYKELSRKYKRSKDDTGSRSWGGVVHAPLSQKAYEKMSKNQWISSFKKYNSDHRNRNANNEKDFLKGGLLEHSRAFSKAVKNNPNKHLEIIDEIINDLNIPIEYSIRE